MVITEMGRLVYQYADDIFSLGRELMHAVQGAPSGRPQHLRVGVTDVVPKLVVRQMLRPVFELAEPVHVTCEEGEFEQLLAGLTVPTLDVVLSDAPLPPGSLVKAFNHVLGECGVTVCAAPALAKSLRGRFPKSLHKAPFLLPTKSGAIRRLLEQWFDATDIQPDIVAEFEDSALLKVFGQDGLGAFAVPDVIADEVERQYGVKRVGEVPEIRERFYAISAERRLKHPAVVAICEQARAGLFR
jgi:LysR family transcriptional activator of nhaA